MPTSRAPPPTLPVASLTPFALLTQLPYPLCRPTLKFRMTFRFPGGLLALQKMQELAPLHLLRGRLKQEGAPPGRPHRSIDPPQQIAGNKNVRSLCVFHMCIENVLWCRSQGICGGGAPPPAKAAAGSGQPLKTDPAGLNNQL